MPELTFGFGQVTAFNVKTQTVTVKSWTGDIIPNMRLDNPPHMQAAPLVRQYDDTSQNLKENLLGSNVFYVEFGDWWRKIISMWNTQQIGQGDLFSTETDPAVLAESSTSQTRQPKPLQQGEVCVAAATQVGAGQLGGCMTLNRVGNVAFNTGSRNTKLVLNDADDEILSSSTLLDLNTDAGIGSFNLNVDAVGTFKLSQRSTKPDILVQLETSTLEMFATGQTRLGNNFGELVLDPTGGFTLSNNALGSIALTALGTVSVSSPTSIGFNAPSLTITAPTFGVTGASTLTGDTAVVGNTTITGNTTLTGNLTATGLITLNGGVQGAARIGDTVVVIVPPGIFGTTVAGTLIPPAPVPLVGTITTGSATTLIGT